MAIICSRLNKSYGHESVIKDFSYMFDEKGIVCLIGPSGCGKTTLINMLLGLLKPDGGSVSGCDDLKFSVVFQQDRLLDWISVKNNLMAVKNDERLCLNALKDLELEDVADKLAKNISGGQKRRAAIARAIVFDADVFIMDEPFKGIDMALKPRIMKAVKASVKNKLCIFITHDAEEAVDMADKIIVLGGKPLFIKKIIAVDKDCKRQKTDIISEIRGSFIL